MLKISRESEISIINMLIDQDIISGKDLPNIKKISTEGNKSQIDAVFELKLTNENKILDEIHEGINDKTLIIISHRNNTVKYCDSIYVMEQGEIIDHGSYKKIMENHKHLREGIIIN